MASNASQLAEEIVVFPPPTLDMTTAIAAYQGQDEDWQKFSFASFQDMGEGQWQYQTEEITIDLTGNSNQEIRISVLGENGATFDHSLKINLLRQSYE